MIPEIGMLTVIGLALMLALYLAKWWYDSNSDKRKKIDEENKAIDNSNDADSLLREFDKLSDK